MNITANTTLGEIVASNISLANTLYRYNLDFCCGGVISLGEACRENNLDIEEVILALANEPHADYATALQFDAWSTELLIDYIVKFHHHYIRTEGIRTYELLEKVCTAHGANNPNLLVIKELFKASLEDLSNHLDKEEQVLFPFIHEVVFAHSNAAPLPNFHCGKLENPISVMEMEHAGEGERFRMIAKLSENYNVPTYACESYASVMHQLKQFEQNLHIHIHVENNILFPRAIRMQDECLFND